MKKLTQIIKEGKELDIQDDAMNFVSADALKDYLEKADKFLSVEAKEVCNWLIANNKTYMKDFGGLAKFYGKGVPKDPELKPLYKNIGILSKKNRLMEIPVFQTEEQFEGIISGKISPDEVLLDLDSEKGRTAVAKKYDALVWKIARSFYGKSNLSLDDLYAWGLEGLTLAMNMYGKSTKSTSSKRMKGKSEEEIAEIEAGEKEAARKTTTFLTYASYLIRIVILENIKINSHLVRIPTSVQNKERKETGRNTKSHNVDGDAAIGKDSDGKGKSLFDTMDGGDDADDGLDKQDIKKLWKGIKDILEKNFSEQSLDIFYSFYGLFGHEKMKAKEIMAKYHLKNPSQVTGSNWKVLHLINTNKTLKKAFAELYSLYKECWNEEDRKQNDDVYIVRD